MHVGLVRERADVPYHLIRSIAIDDDLPQGVAHLTQVGIFAIEKEQAGLSVSGDGGERLVHSARDRGRQLPRWSRALHARARSELCEAPLSALGP